MTKKQTQLQDLLSQIWNMLPLNVNARLISPLSDPYLNAAIASDPFKQIDIMKKIRDKPLGSLVETINPDAKGV